MFTHSLRDPGFVAVATPASSGPVSGMTLWLDGQDAGTLSISGSNVESWTDKSGNGYVFTRNNDVVTSTINSKVAVRGQDWGGNYLASTATLANIITASAFTVFAAFKVNLMETDGGSGIFAGVISDVNGNFIFGITDATTPDLMTRINDGSDKIATSDISGIYTTGVVGVGQHTGGNIRSKVGSGSWSANTAAGNNATTGTLRIFAGAGAQPWFHGTIGELLVYNTALSDANVNTNVAYLQARWAL
jgi:hypothetical protein